MSLKGRPTHEKKNNRFEIRLSNETLKILENCSISLEISKSEVIHQGIALVNAKINKK